MTITIPKERTLREAMAAQPVQIVKELPALKIYDIEIDNFRAPTQADLDDFMALRRVYGKLRGKGLVPDDIHNELVATLKEHRQADAA